jgi:hypothetical protein
MKAIPNNKTFAAAYLMRSKILYVQISRIMAHYGLRRAPVIQSPSRTAFSLKSSVVPPPPRRTTEAPAALPTARSIPSPSPSRLNKGQKAFR